MQPFIIIHLVAALLALFLGAIVLSRRKGTTSHRLLGWVWVVLMVIICLSSFFIQTIYPFGWFNFIHLLSVFKNEEALAFYQEHPEHKKAAVYLKQVTCNRVCFDY